MVDTPLSRHQPPQGRTSGQDAASAAEGRVPEDTADSAELVDRLVEEYRDRALWFLRPDYYPRSDEERLQVLAYIEQRADLPTFRRVARLRQCLLRTTSARSAG